MKKFMLVDGNALLHRAYHALPPLSTSSGELVNAVYGLTSTLLTMMKQLQPDYVAICWDRKAPTFRHIQYVGYKANRAEMDEGLASQYERVDQVMDALNIPAFSLDGFEADDLIGTLARQAKKKKVKTIIVTGDRDAFQLIDQSTTVFVPSRSMRDAEEVDEKAFTKKYGFSPKLLVDYKALAGDASDNIPGVKGIGEKTATSLIREFGTIEKIYASLGKIPERVRTKLANDAEHAAMSRKLATIVCDAPIRLELSKCKTHDYDEKKVKEVFVELEFMSLLRQFLGKDSGQAGVTVSNTTTSLDQKLASVLTAMSKHGVLIDQNALAALGRELKRLILQTERRIFHHVGHEFNIRSTKQLGTILFDELGLTVVKKTKTGRSTDESVLHALKTAHPAIPEILRYRELSKLQNTYVEAWPKFIGDDGRIHSTFHLAGAVTGRLSSTNPNLQNIPIRGDWGARIRRVVIAPKGKLLLSADYSQIDLRVMAHLANDPGLKKAFAEKRDIHAITAAKMFHKKTEDVSADERRHAKAVVFGLMYGMGPRSLSKQLKVSFAEAQMFIARYFAAFPKVQEFMEKTIRDAHEKGYVETPLGRRRSVPELVATNARIRAGGERMALNFPIQGGSADIINTAMVEIGAAGKGYQLVLQVHDELLFEVEEGQVRDVAKRVKEKMESAMKLSVPLVVDVKVGRSWGTMREIDNTA